MGQRLRVDGLQVGVQLFGERRRRAQPQRRRAAMNAIADRGGVEAARDGGDRMRNARLIVGVGGANAIIGGRRHRRRCCFYFADGNNCWRVIEEKQKGSDEAKKRRRRRHHHQSGMWCGENYFQIYFTVIYYNLEDSELFKQKGVTNFWRD